MIHDMLVRTQEAMAGVQLACIRAWSKLRPPFCHTAGFWTETVEATVVACSSTCEWIHTGTHLQGAKPHLGSRCILCSLGRDRFITLSKCHCSAEDDSHTNMLIGSRCRKARCKFPTHSPPVPGVTPLGKFNGWPALLMPQSCRVFPKMKFCQTLCRTVYFDRNCSWLPLCRLKHQFISCIPGCPYLGGVARHAEMEPQCAWGAEGDVLAASQVVHSAASCAKLYHSNVDLHDRQWSPARQSTHRISSVSQHMCRYLGGSWRGCIDQNRSSGLPDRCLSDELASFQI